MKLTASDIQDFAEIMGQAEQFRPLVNMVIDTLLSYRPEISKLSSAFNEGIANGRINAVKRYEAAGFNRDDAILMTLDDAAALRKALQRSNASLKKAAA